MWSLLDAYGETLYLSDEIEAMAMERQLDHTLLDQRADLVNEYLETLLPQDWYQRNRAARDEWFQNPRATRSAGSLRRDKVSPIEIWTECLGKKSGDFRRSDGAAISDIMRQIPGWQRSRSTIRITGIDSGRYFVRCGRTEEQAVHALDL